MNTIVFLILIIGGRDVAIYEMPNMQMCESLGKSIPKMVRQIKWNCIEGVR